MKFIFPSQENNFSPEFAVFPSQGNRAQQYVKWIYKQLEQKLDLKTFLYIILSHTGSAIDFIENIVFL